MVGPRLRTNLCFHGIGVPQRPLEDGEETFWISEELFGAILDLVADRDDVALSFDDGNISDVSMGLPALTRHGLCADFFPLAGRIGSPGSLDVADIQALIAAGMAVGSHGMHHRAWRETAADELAEELDTARDVLVAAAGTTITAVACPFGSYDRRVLKEIKSRGYSRVLTSDRARARPASWLQPRFSVTADDTVESVRALLDPPGLVRQTFGEARTWAKRWR